jgi:glucokinase
MILAGDVGGTKVHLALFDSKDSKLRILEDQKYKAIEYGSLDEVITAFLESHQIDRRAIDAACFGCPGPTRTGRVILTNLSWIVDVKDLVTCLGTEHVYLLNDLEATAYGIPELSPLCIHTLHAGEDDPHANRGLIAAGTGLGEAIIIKDNDRYLPVSSEGGHCDFAPNSDREVALLGYLRQKLQGHVSYERVVSGIGMHNIYTYLRDVENMDEPAWLKHRMEHEDPNAVITEEAQENGNPLCVETIEMFVTVYGAEAGNLALKSLALGGLYLGGGIAPKIVNILDNGSFMKAFLHKGRLSQLLGVVPVRVITNERCALLGAAAYALRKLQARSLPTHTEAI